jgi:hypothetical protein
VQQIRVAIALPGAFGEEVAAWADAAGWQVVGVDGGPETAGSFALAPSVVPGWPSVVVIDGAPSAAQARAALQSGAVDVVGWPEDRARLLEVPDRLAPARVRAPGPRRIAVAGVAGGTGVSTVALGVGALLAWGGRRTVVVGGDDLLALCARDPWRGPGAQELALLDGPGAAAEARQLTRPVPGVPGLGVLGGGGVHVGGTDGWPCEVVVLDLRTDDRGRADLLCARPDVHLPAAAARDGAVLLVGEGPLGSGQVRAALGRRPAGALPTSARVARAGVLGRVPSGLPGSWLAALRSILVDALP